MRGKVLEVDYFDSLSLLPVSSIMFEISLLKSTALFEVMTGSPVQLFNGKSRSPCCFATSTGYSLVFFKCISYLFFEISVVIASLALHRRPLYPDQYILLQPY